MKRLPIAALMCFVLLFASFTKLFAQSEQEQKIRSSYMLALGKDASAGEVNYWKGQGNLSIAQLMDRHRQYFKANSGVQREIIVRSYVAAFGRNPSEGEIAYYANGNLNYAELVNGHMGFLIRNSTEQENTIKRAYRYVLGRQPSAQEIGAGVASGALSYLFWVGWLQDPARIKNTINVQKAPILAAVPVSSSIANEARSAAGMVAAGGGNMVAAGGGNMVAAGGGNMVAAGGGNMVAAGGGN